MSIYLNESVEDLYDESTFNEAADYVVGCINGDYDIDVDTLRESAEYVLNEISEKRSNRLYDKALKAYKTIVNSFADKPIKNKDYNDKEGFQKEHQALRNSEYYKKIMAGEGREDGIRKIMDDPRGFKKQLRYMKKGARQAKRGKYTGYNEVI